MKLSKWLMSFSSEGLAILPRVPLRHLTMNMMRVRRKMKMKMPPRMNRNFYKRSQKSNTSIYNCSERSIEPWLVSLMPRIKFYGYPFCWVLKTIRGVLSLAQPYFIYQSLPPGRALLLSRMSKSPLSYHTSMDYWLMLAALWQRVKMRTTQESGS